jgi:hypothetical protein
VRHIAARVWSLLDGEPSALDRLELVGEPRVLPSVFDVTGLASATVGVATLAAAELHATRNERALDPVVVTTREASAAFRCESLFAPDGWTLAPIWDPIAGDYRGADGWIRLHTNYAHHRAAALQVLGSGEADRDAVEADVARWHVDELESRVVEAGGAAAAMHTRDQWLIHPHGAATASTAPVEIMPRPGGIAASLPASEAPLGGVKVLDLTRVIAGPFATRFLAAWGAQVLRVDPPGFEEVPAVVPETTAGKRCAFLDLTTTRGRDRLLDLVSEADVVVHGYRPGALDALGLDESTLCGSNPALIISQHDAYGWTGPWAGRRGFDSLVQMSCGIAAARGADRPRPLPAQALDHATGMLIAAAVCRALTTRTQTGVPASIRCSLIGAANLLCELPDRGSMAVDAPSFTIDDLEPRHTWWGPSRAVPIPGRIGSRRPTLQIEPGPLGRHDPTFTP